ncbi:hypothetical protein ACTOB_001206 [Actinoplanes oblitus]|uniref:Uncharacterized protein n=1 Tax=Actinoplanes oblitus TaxID=3040509 RepID=A0ABY8WIE3_9ACTN|nr:hypothetical protein [Actinoplanes oblitus]WIM97659.1 hypothetical protein ACTOB_001206 [Actinoplanes oblitus]
MTDPTRVADSSDEPPTSHVPDRWSGAAPVPATVPRRSMWERLVERVSGEPEPEHWATMPAVDPWAGQDTPVWTTEQLPPVEMPPTRLDASTSTRPAAVLPEKERKIRALLNDIAAKARESPPLNGTLPAVPQESGPPKAAGWFRRPKTRTPKTRTPAARTPAANPPAATPNRVPIQPRPPEAARPGWPPRPPEGARPGRPPRPRRRGRRLRRLLLIIAILAGLWFGAPFAYDRWPALAQFPVSAELPDRVGDLRLRADQASKRALDRLTDQLSAAGAGGAAFAGVYGDGNGKRVTLYGVTGWRFTPDADVTRQLDRVSDEVGLTDVQDYPLDESGAYERCGTGRLNGTSTVVCTWADHGSMATVLLTRRSIADSAELVARLRGELLAPKFGA